MEIFLLPINIFLLAINIFLFVIAIIAIDIKNSLSRLTSMLEDE